MDMKGSSCNFERMGQLASQPGINKSTSTLRQKSYIFGSRGERRETRIGSLYLVVLKGWKKGEAGHMMRVIFFEKGANRRINVLSERGATSQP